MTPASFAWAFATTAIGLGIARAPAAATPADFDVIPVADGVWAAIARDDGMAISNAGIVDLGDRVILVDATMAPAAAQRLTEQALALTGKPVTHVVHTHWHGDHVFGDGGLPTGVEVVGTSATRAAMKEQIKDLAALKKDDEAYLAEKSALLKKAKAPFDQLELSRMVSMARAELSAIPSLSTPRLPTTLFSGEMSIVGTRRTARILELGRGHTISDSVVLVPEAGVVFAGDVLFIDFHPWTLDGDVDDWRAALAHLAALPAQKIVPGHGRVGGADDVLTLRRYFDDVDAEARALAQQGVKPDAVAKRKPPAPWSTWGYERFWGHTLKARVQKLTVPSSKVN